MKDQLVYLNSLASNLGASKTKPPGEWPIIKFFFGYIILLATWDQAFQLEPVRFGLKELEALKRTLSWYNCFWLEQSKIIERNDK